MEGIIDTTKNKKNYQKILVNNTLPREKYMAIHRAFSLSPL